MSKSIVFLIRARNAFEFFDRCIDSVFSQKNKNFSIIYIDDESQYTLTKKKYIRQKLRNHIVQFNKKRKYSVRNAYEAIHRYVPDDAVVISLDGDDWLIRDDVIDIISKTYSVKNCSLTYGNCMYFSPGKHTHNKIATEAHPFANTRYSAQTELSKSYRLDYFRPLHLKTWRAGFFKSIPKDRFLFPNGEWIRFCEDQAIFYPMLEVAGGAYEVIDIPLSAYNASYIHNDAVQNRLEKIADEVTIRRHTRNKNSRLLKGEFSPVGNNELDFYIHYSPWSRGRIGSLYLIYQIFLVACNMTRVIYLGNQKRRLERILITVAENKSSQFNVLSFDCGFSLSQCTRPILIDGRWNSRKSSVQQLEVAMWSLTFGQAITTGSFDSLQLLGSILKKYGIVSDV